jgi:hypothetical protein
MSKEKYSIDELYVDLSSIYSDYERGKINKELVTETASNICQAFIIGKKFSDAELDIIEEKICPDCGDLLADLNITINKAETNLIRGTISNEQALEMIIQECINFVNTNTVHLSHPDRKMLGISCGKIFFG